MTVIIAVGVTTGMIGTIVMTEMTEIIAATVRARDRGVTKTRQGALATMAAETRRPQKQHPVGKATRYVHPGIL